MTEMEIQFGDATYDINDTSGCGLTKDEYEDLKKTMLQSIYQNGGFWIGRYEAGLNEENYRTSHSAISAIPTSKANEYPYTWITCSEAQTLASKVNSGNYTSSLMFGVQWNLVLKYLEVKSVEKGTDVTTAQRELNSDSTSWGNYRKSTFTLNRGRYTSLIGQLSLWNDYTEDFGTYVIDSMKQSNTMVFLTTGASDDLCKQNIYDLAGNALELTLEYQKAVYSSQYPCVTRGGRCSNIYNYDIAASSSYELLTPASGQDISFRVSIY